MPRGPPHPPVARAPSPPVPVQHGFLLPRRDRLFSDRRKSIREYRRRTRCLFGAFLGLVFLGMVPTALYGMAGLGQSKASFSGRQEGPFIILSPQGRELSPPAMLRHAISGSWQGEAEKKLNLENLAAKFRQVLAWAGSSPAKGSPHWQLLDPEFGAFVYAAHYDDVSLPPVVRVVGFSRADLSGLSVTCRFDGSQSLSPAHTSGTLYHFRPNEDRSGYVGAYIECSLPKDCPSFPTAVSVSLRETSSQTHHSSNASSTTSSGNASSSPGTEEENLTYLNYLHIHYSHSPAWQRSHSAPEPLLVNITDNVRRINRLRALDPGWRWNITRCFPAMVNRYNDHVMLAQMVAASLALGVEHFVFYVQSVGPEVLRMLQVLVERGVAEVHPWNLNISWGDLMNYGQFPAIQDCLYRNLWSSRFLLFGDLDEIFVPRQETSLFDLLLNTLEQDALCACLLFLHTFYNFRYSTQIPPAEVDPLRLSLRHRLSLMTQTWREKMVLKAGKRSKVAVDPHKTLTGSVHVIQTSRKGFFTCVLNDSRGLLHHYRAETPVSTLVVNDPFLWRFSGPFLSTLDTLLTHFNNSMLRPLSENILGL